MMAVGAPANLRPTSAAFIESCARQRAIPVVRTTQSGLAERAARWCREEGFTIIEITLTCPDALDVIALLAATGGVMVGAGTVLSVADAEDAVSAGARFLVTPVGVAELEPDAIAVPLVAGALTPTEIRARHAEGAAAVKVFPVREAGGPAYIKAVREVFLGVQLIPTGGVGPDDAGEYLAAGAIAVGVGGSLVGPDLLAGNDRAAFAERATRLRRAVGL